MWKLLGISIGLGVWGCVGGFDWIYDTADCLLVYAEKWNTDLIHNFYYKDIAKEKKMVLITFENEIRTYTLDQAKDLVWDAARNKSLNSTGGLDINVTPEELLKNKDVFNQAKIYYANRAVDLQLKNIDHIHKLSAYERFLIKK